jgi:hypothetical protein
VDCELVAASKAEGLVGLSPLLTREYMAFTTFACVT